MANSLTPAQRQRNRVAALTKHHPGSTRLADARRDLAAENLAAYIARIVDAAPPLTPSQRDVIVSLLRPPGSSGPPPASGGTKSPTASGGTMCAETVIQSLPIGGDAA